MSASPNSFLLALEVPRDFPRPGPGQFLHVAAPGPLTLRRPFSVAGAPEPGVVELLIELRGTGTRALASAPIGTRLSVLGPLGNGFTMPEEDETALLVAGGIGVAGLRYLADVLLAAGRRVVALVGARTSESLLHHVLPSALDGDRGVVKLATDDGSVGFRGTVCKLLGREAAEEKGLARIYACGPPAMLRQVAALARSRRIPCEVLLEEIMACGVGACRGCVVPTTRGYKTVCSDGPVFDATELVFEEPAHA